MANKTAIPPDVEELSVYVALAVIGAIPAVIALIARRPFGGDSTLGLMMVAIGLAGMLVQLRRFLDRRVV